MKSKIVAALLALFVLPMMAAAPHAALTVAAAATGGAQLTWVNPNGGTTTINVYRCAGATCTNFTLLVSGVVAAGPYVDTTVAAGSSSYQVKAVAQDGTLSPASNTAVYTLTPLAPTGLTAQ